MTIYDLNFGPIVVRLERAMPTPAAATYSVNGRVMVTVPPSYTFKDIVSMPDVVKELRKEVQLVDPRLTRDEVEAAFESVSI